MALKRGIDKAVEKVVASLECPVPKTIGNDSRKIQQVASISAQ